jgi:hypothetical protein
MKTDDFCIIVKYKQRYANEKFENSQKDEKSDGTNKDTRMKNLKI